MTISRILLAMVGAAGLAAAQNTTQSTITLSGSGLDCPALNWTFDASQTSTGQTTRGQISALVVNRQLDQCSPRLFQLVPSGLRLDSVVVTEYESSSSSRIPVLTVTLRGVRVSNYQVGGTTASPLPGESVAFTFESIKLEYQNPNGGAPVWAGWDFTANRSIP